MIFKGCIIFLVNNMGIGRPNNWETLADNRTDSRKIIYNEQINLVNERQVEAASRELLIFNVCATEYAYLMLI